jgi:hypothetical protein
VRLLLLLVCLPAVALAQGSGGDPRDRLDAPGSPTDRYLEPAELREALHGATQEFFLCFRRHLGIGREPGEISVEFAIDRDGVPQQVRLQGPASTPDPLRDCLVAVTEGIRFDDHDGDPVEAAYPLVFVTDSQGARVLPYPVVFVRPRPVRLPLLLLPPDISRGEVLMLERILVSEDEAPTPEELVPSPPAATPEPAPPKDSSPEAPAD